MRFLSLIFLLNLGVSASAEPIFFTCDWISTSEPVSCQTVEIWADIERGISSHSDEPEDFIVTDDFIVMKRDVGAFLMQAVHIDQI